jgi:glyoxylase-like metal-dependent hydrolase (beta-lactamase superfamily II)
MPASKIDRPIEDGDEIAAGNGSIRALHTPGHTPGSTCYVAGRILFSGDVLFPGGPGRTQRPADLQQSIKSIKERLFALPDETIVLPGHGDDTTIGESKREYAVFASREHPPDLAGDVTWAG